MPRFSYTVKNKEGKTIKSFLDAHNKQAIVERLHREGYFIVDVREISPFAGGKKTFKKKRKFNHGGIKLQDFLTFARQMTTMLEAGITLNRSLDVIQTQTQSERFFKILNQIKKDVEQGGALSLALSKHPGVFNQFWVSLVEIGEASGTLPEVLNKLAVYLEQQAEFRSSIISAMVYPIILFFVAMGAVGFFALFVAPRFEAIFESMKVDLPLLTVLLLAFFKIVKANFLLIICTLVVSLFLLRRFTRTYLGRGLYEKFLFRLPVIGEIYKLIVVERFSSQMAILLDSGVPILYALDISERLVSNQTCAFLIAGIKEAVREGESLVKPMERSDFFPPMAVQMISVGEETGELSKMLKHVAQFYQSSVETFMKRFSTLVEPLMIVIMGAVIGVIVVAMFLPLFNIAQGGGMGK